MTSLADMNARMQGWINEKSSNFDNGNELRTNTGDVVFFQFVSSGSDGDQFISGYKSHIFLMTSNKGTKYNKAVWCPVQSGHTDIPCTHCANNIGDIKERMSIWMYVFTILHAQMPAEKQYPQVQHNGKIYFREDINDFRIWHTSAWRESPWNSIVKLNELYKGLHNFTAQLEHIGAGTATRYLVYAIPNSDSLSTEIYEKAKAECEPIPNILKAQLGSPVQTAPQQQTSSVSAGSVPVTIQPFNPPGSAAAPVFEFSRPKENAAPVTVESLPWETPVQAPVEQVQQAMEKVQEENKPEEDTHRPTKSMF